MRYILAPYPEIVRIFADLFSVYERSNLVVWDELDGTMEEMRLFFPACF